MKSNQTLREFLRYALVGGAAFGVDYGVLVLFREVVLKGLGAAAVYWAAAAGFIAGVITNYLFSMAFVFVRPEQRKKGGRASAMILFVLIGLTGLGLTEAGMWLGVGLLGLHYTLVKLLVAGGIMVWNYAARKLLIFK